jgi:3-oxoacyl-[acyl-carrier protein] reductase
MTHMKLQGKIAIITGGNKGIGKSIAWRFASEGAIVILVARAEQELQQVCGELVYTGWKAEAIQADVS